MYYIAYCLIFFKASVYTLCIFQLKTDAMALVAIEFIHTWLKLLPTNKTTPSQKRDEVESYNYLCKLNEFQMSTIARSIQSLIFSDRVRT